MEPPSQSPESPGGGSPRPLGVDPEPAGRAIESPGGGSPRPLGDDSQRSEPAGRAIAFDSRGLVPCVIQDWRSGEVLTLAYMNAEALELSRSTGELHLFSRSRDELWHKGATSGNTQAVKALRFDCDADAVLALVEPAGPACHTGDRTCFFSGDTQALPYEALPGLERTLADRVENPKAGSYTNRL